MNFFLFTNFKSIALCKTLERSRWTLFSTLAFPQQIACMYAIFHIHLVRCLSHRHIVYCFSHTFGPLTLSPAHCMLFFAYILYPGTYFQRKKSCFQENVFSESSPCQITGSLFVYINLSSGHSFTFAVSGGSSKNQAQTSECQTGKIIRRRTGFARLRQGSIHRHTA